VTSQSKYRWSISIVHFVLARDVFFLFHELAQAGLPGTLVLAWDPVGTELWI
jgi:hypothetical protein